MKQNKKQIKIVAIIIPIQNVSTVCLNRKQLKINQNPVNILLTKIVQFVNLLQKKKLFKKLLKNVII